MQGREYWLALSLAGRYPGIEWPHRHHKCFGTQNVSEAGRAGKTFGRAHETENHKNPPAPEMKLTERGAGRLPRPRGTGRQAKGACDGVDLWGRVEERRVDFNEGASAKEGVRQWRGGEEGGEY